MCKYVHPSYAAIFLVVSVLLEPGLRFLVTLLWCVNGVHCVSFELV